MGKGSAIFRNLFAGSLFVFWAAACAKSEMCNPSDPGAQCSRDSAMLELLLQPPRAETPSTSGPCNPCRIFVSSSANAPGVDFNGVSGADARCRSDALYPGSGTYKALLAEPGVRIACTTSNCSGGPAEHTDWILRADTTYKRMSDGATIMTTNADGIFNFGSNLTSAIESGVTGWWTGLTQTWVFGSACTGNTWSSTGGSANFGDPSTMSGAAISNGTDLCTTTASKLLCVEQ